MQNLRSFFAQKNVPFIFCSNEPAAMEETQDAIIASGDGFRYTFCKHRGTFVSLVINGVEQLESPMELTMFRAPIDNERKIKHLWTNHVT